MREAATENLHRIRHAVAAWLALCLAMPGCAQGIDWDDDDGDPSSATDDDGWDGDDSTPPEGDGSGGDLIWDDSPPEIFDNCEDTPLAGWQWWGSLPFADTADPVDGDGRAFWEVDYNMVDYSTVAMPDEGHAPPGLDRAYRTEFWLDATLPGVYLSVQSDDGLWLWVNGVEVGHWGGSWQEEGCVNDMANCTKAVVVPPVEVTPYLVSGNNVMAARVSNAIQNAYFDLLPYCVE